MTIQYTCVGSTSGRCNQKHTSLMDAIECLVRHRKKNFNFSNRKIEIYRDGCLVGYMHETPDEWEAVDLKGKPFNVRLP